jgi:YidC/Oxa1 family membrane protein insertase
MQNQQSRQTTLFILVSMGIMLGWFYIEAKIWPPKLHPLARQQLLTKLSSFLPADHGLPEMARVGALNLVLNPPKDLPKPKAEPEPVPVLVAADQGQEVQLGAAQFNLMVRLTTTGAAVKQVLLTQFQQADQNGLPATNADGTPKALHLVPGDAALSYLLAHYGQKDDPRPLDTLSRRVWEFVGSSTEGDTHTASYATTLASHGVRLTKTYTLAKGDYHVGLSLKIDRLDEAKDAPAFRYQLGGARSLPIEGEWFTTTYRNALAGWTEANGYPRRYLEEVTGINLKAGGDRIPRPNKGTIDYAGVGVQYFASVLAVDDQQPDKKRDFIEFVRATDEFRLDTFRPQLDDITTRMIAEPLALKAGESVTHNFLLYNGPIKIRLLRQMGTQGKTPVDDAVVQRYEKLHLDTMTDAATPYWSGGMLDFVGWITLLIWCTNLMHWLLGFLQAYLPGGLAIILLTVLVRGVLLPFSYRQAVMSAKMQAVMTKLQPQFKEIAEKYKDDFQEQQRAKSELMLKHGLNPIAQLGGCLLLLVQMPVFMGLYYALQESIFFRLESFLWIRNLAAPDMLLRLWDIPYVTTPTSNRDFFHLNLGPYFNILPIFAAVFMFVQQKLMMPPPTDPEQATQQRVMQYMTLLMGIMFYKVPAGLCLYFIASSIWGLAERAVIPKPKPSDPNAPANSINPVSEPTIIDAPRQQQSGSLIDRARKKKKGKNPPPPPPASEPKTVSEKMKRWWEKLLDDARKKGPHEK